MKKFGILLGLSLPGILSCAPAIAVSHYELVGVLNKPVASVTAYNNALPGAGWTGRQTLDGDTKSLLTQWEWIRENPADDPPTMRFQVGVSHTGGDVVADTIWWDYSHGSIALSASLDDPIHGLDFASWYFPWAEATSPGIGRITTNIPASTNSIKGINVNPEYRADVRAHYISGRVNVSIFNREYELAREFDNDDDSRASISIPGITISTNSVALVSVP